MLLQFRNMNEYPEVVTDPHRISQFVFLLFYVFIIMLLASLVGDSCDFLKTNIPILKSFFFMIKMQTFELKD